MKKYRTWSPEQSFLLPPSPMDWLPEGHLAYFLLDVVGELDLRAIEAAIHAKDARGERPYSPQMMTALLIYAYCTGVFSSRRIERATEEDVAFRVIAGGAHPHWTTINAFRLEHRDALAGLFTQVLTLCRRAGLKTAGHIALDGTKIQANASKHKAMSYERMKADEKRLADEVEALMRRAKDADTRDDAEFGNLRGDELPAELAHRNSRLEKIREAKKALEAEAAKSRAGQLRENAAALRQKLDDRTSTPKEKKTAATLADKVEKAAARLDSGDDDDSDEGGGTSATELPKHRIQTTPAGTPKSNAQRNFTDPESRIMIRNGTFLQAFNAQAAVSEDQIIVAHGVSNDPTDARQLRPMVERITASCGAPPDVLSADTGYLAEANIQFCAERGIDAYIATPKADIVKLVAVPDTPALMTRWAMHQKVTSPRGRTVYAKRKILVEPVFGQIKSAMGFRRFSLRGLRKSAAEWGFVCACHNLLKAFRAAPLATAT